MKNKLLALREKVLKGVKKHHKNKKKIKNIIILLISIGIILSGMIFIWLSTIKIPDLSSFEKRRVAQSTKIYDRTGQIVLYDIHENTKRTVVPLANISRNIKNATIAIEDAEFYQHFGIQPKSIIRAVIANLLPGGLKQGGSTITQQVIKNTVLTSDRTITRKLKEWVLAIKLEKMISKDKILEIYLNETPYGGSLYGVEEASKTFFGKSASDLSLAQSAYIAALPQAPTFYSPYGKNKASLDERQKLVLKKMLEYKFITDDEYKQALEEKVEFLEKNDSSIRAPHFSMYVRDYLINKYGQDTVEQGGLKVITTLDYKMQQKAEETIRSFAPKIEQNFNASNTAMVAIDPKTGDILTMIGSRDYFEKENDGNFNVALAHRQPGSTFKPFVYATAFKKGYTPETILFDTKTEFSSDCTPQSKPKIPNAVCYSPNDYDNKFDGPKSIRYSLAQSRNIPAVKALYLVGIKDAIATAEDMGIESLTEPDRYGLTMVLGGGEVTLLEMTSAYSVFANEGVRNPYRSVLRVEDSAGKVLEEAKTNPTEVLDSNIARQISDILSDPKVMSQSIKTIVPPGRQVAAKTGTTNDYKDVWMMGYTPNLAVGAWAGKNDNTPMERKVAGLIIAPVWGAFLTEALKDMPDERFRKPDPTPENIKPVLREIWKGGISYFIDKISKKVATEYTPNETKEERVFTGVHDILRWVIKDDPRGPYPSNPEKDSQYANWEYGVREWFKEWQTNNPGFIETQDYTVPTETDDVHLPQYFPKIKIITPVNNQTINNDSKFTISFQKTNGRYPIKKAEFFVNDQYLGSADSEPFNLSFLPKNIDNVSEENTIKVVVTDTVYSKGEDSVVFRVK